jgi:NAD(P)-dependent dehydrogenase (short-subunit alcohol dehydrogenase family)
MNDNKRFQDKVALVTGAASGIGLATAQRFLQEGAKVVMVDINPDKLQAAQKQIASDPMQTLTCTCDVANPADVEKAVNRTLEYFGQIDVIVNNAGLMIFKELEKQTPAEWNKVLSVDLLGTFYFIQQGFLHMKKGGSIVNVASIHAVETTPLVSSYAAAKAAVLSLTRSAAIEGKPKGIRVNAVLPGAVNTPMLWENPNIKSGLEVINHSDVGEAKDIAAAIAYLASADAAFIQGANLRVDGGRLAQL